MSEDSKSERPALLISIKPHYVDKILTGEKTIELRRRFPALRSGDTIVIYATRPVAAVVATGIVREILRDNPKCLWRHVHTRCGVDETTYEKYFAGSASAVGILLRDIRRHRKPILLSELRQRFRGFHPPQSYRFLNTDDMRQALIAA